MHRRLTGPLTSLELSDEDTMIYTFWRWVAHAWVMCWIEQMRSWKEYLGFVLENPDSKGNGGVAASDSRLAGSARNQRQAESARK